MPSQFHSGKEMLWTELSSYFFFFLVHQWFWDSFHLPESSTWLLDTVCCVLFNVLIIRMLFCMQHILISSISMILIQLHFEVCNPFEVTTKDTDCCLTKCPKACTWRYNMIICYSTKLCNLHNENYFKSIQLLMQKNIWGKEGMFSEVCLLEYWLYKYPVTLVLSIIKFCRTLANETLWQSKFLDVVKGF